MIKFSKMHGAGNDFIITKIEYVKGLDHSKLAKIICNRHFGIGADGLMLVEKSDIATVKMIYYNSDGSIAEMCGNGIRCFSKYVYDNNIINTDSFTIETLAGIKNIKLTLNGNEIEKIVVDMGKPILNPKYIPVVTNKDKFINEEIIVQEKKYKVSTILMGVPHTIIFTDNLEENSIYKIGPIIENLNIYPHRTNVNFVKVINKTSIKVDTWERGAGKTLACGTGVCASVFIAKLLNFVDNNVEVEVPGGKLNIYIDKKDNIFMEGDAELICEGKYYLKDYLKIC